MRIRNILAVLAAVAVLGGHMSWQSLDRLHLTWLDWNATVGDALGNGKTPTTGGWGLEVSRRVAECFPPLPRFADIVNKAAIRAAIFDDAGHKGGEHFFR
jgi:hypothetical protein